MKSTLILVFLQCLLTGFCEGKTTEGNIGPTTTEGTALAITQEPPVPYTTEATAITQEPPVPYTTEATAITQEPPVPYTTEATAITQEPPVPYTTEATAITQEPPVPYTTEAPAITQEPPVPYATEAPAITQEPPVPYTTEAPAITQEPPVPYATTPETTDATQESNHTDSNTTTPTGSSCPPGLCENGGTCVMAGRTYSCQCLEYFTGQFCQVYDAMRNAQNVDVNSEASFLQVITWIQNISKNTNNLDVLITMSAAIDVLIEKLSTSSLTETQTVVVRTGLLEGADGILDSVKARSATAISGACSSTEDTGEIDETTPKATEPAGIETTATEPAAIETTPTEPAAIDTTATEPTAIETTATEPAATETTATEPAGIETTETEPTAIETATGPAGIETTATEPTAIETTATEPAIIETTATEPAGIETTATEPTATEPTAIEPTPTEPAAIETTPAGIETTPTEPAAIETTPTESAATEPTAIETTPAGIETTPAGIEPTPIEPTPTESAATEPTPTEPAAMETTRIEPTEIETTPTESAATEPTPTGPAAIETTATVTTATEPAGIETTPTEPAAIETTPTESAGIEPEATTTYATVPEATQEFTHTDSNTTMPTDLQEGTTIPGASCSIEDKRKQQQVVDSVLKSIVNIGNVALANENVATLTLYAENFKVTFTKATVASLSVPRDDDEIDDVILPRSLGDLVKDTGYILANIETDSKHYFAEEDVVVSGPVLRVAMTTTSGESVNDIDSDDPVLIAVDALSNISFSDLELGVEDSSQIAVQQLSFIEAAQIQTEIRFPSGTVVLIRARFGELPRNYERDFELHINNGVHVVISSRYVDYAVKDNTLHLSLDKATEGRDIYISIQFWLPSGGRNRSNIAPGIRARTISPRVWNSHNLAWEYNTGLEINGIKDTGKVQFKSNFFGTFALSEMVVAPTPIDFNRLFLNFDTYLRDSPYVLAVNCFLVAMTILLALLLRRYDREDRLLWRYYPLIDNPNEGEYTYSLSVHTSIRSARGLEVTPYFILSGGTSSTKPRIMADGCRQNFTPGSVSNFYLTSDTNLGDLYKIKIWHTNQSESAKWHLNRIVIVDLQKRKRYMFLCQKWLALGEDDGRTCRTFEAFSDNSEEVSMLDIISKQKLFDDHLWLSVIKRPSFSRFSRVQRFLCAVAMLFLSMVTSAMWYKDYDTGSQKSTGLEIGPLKLNYRQVFVGAVSAVIIMVPGILMTLAFKMRKLKGEVTEEGRWHGYVKGKWLFPWWFVFIGYTVVVLAIGGSAFFTFLYSLQWGGTTSLNWLMSLLFCTTGSTCFVEPAKIIVLSVVLSSLFKKTIERDIGIIAPMKIHGKKGVQAIIQGSPVIEEPADEDSEEVEQRRKDLVLKGRLMNTGKGLAGSLLFIVLVAVICLHNDVTDSYRGNTLVKGYANETFISKYVHTPDDVWLWLEKMFIPALYPKTNYNGDRMSVYDQRFAQDGVNLRTGPINLRQYRVTDDCGDVSLKSKYGLDFTCIPQYSEQTAQLGVFTEGWGTCNNSDSTSCLEKAFLPSTSIAGSSVLLLGIFGTYGDRSYVENWNYDQTYASSRARFLEINNWLDHRSRALVFDAPLYNANSRLFTRLQVLFEFPTTGDVTFIVDASSAKLYPYVNVWDYLVLLLQIIFGVIVLVRLCRFYCSVFCVRDSRSVSGVLVFGSEMVLSVGAMVIYGVKIDRTIYVVEEIRNNPDSYISFDLVHLLDSLYRLCISLVLFIRILSLLKTLSINYNLFVMRTTLMVSQKELWAFSFVLVIVATAFASLFYLLEGPKTFDTRSIAYTFMTLFKSLLGLIRSNQFILSNVAFESTAKQVVFILFYFSATLISMNIAISILTIDMTSIKGKTAYKLGPGFDKELNDYLWKSAASLLTKCHSKQA